MRQVIFFVAQLSVLLPDALTRLPYLLAFWLVKFIFSCYGFKLLLRNGLWQGRVVWGISDIDCNLLFEKTPTQEQLNTFFKLYRRFKRVIPILGEYNIICKQQLDLLLETGNYYCLERDPLFSSLLVREARPSEKVIFIVRALQANRQHFRLYPHMIRNKWRNYFKRIGVDDNSFPSELNEKNIAEFLAQKFRSRVNSSMLQFLATYQAKTDSEINDFYRQRGLCLEMMALLPAKWLGAAFLYQSYEEDIQAISNAPSFYVESFIEGIRWEVWGLSTQYLILDGQQLITHLGNIAVVLKKIDDKIKHSDLHDLIASVDHLMELVRNAGAAFKNQRTP